MRRLLVFLLLAISLTAFAKDHEWQDGKLLSVDTDGNGMQNWVVFTVGVSGIIYTTKGQRVYTFSKDYSKGLVIGDPLKAAAEGGHLILLLPDGKTMTTNILSRKRAFDPNVSGQESH